MYFVPCLSSSCLTCAPSCASCSSETSALAIPSVVWTPHPARNTRLLRTSAPTDVRNMRPPCLDGWCLPAQRATAGHPADTLPGRPLPSGPDRGNPTTHHGASVLERCDQLRAGERSGVAHLGDTAARLQLSPLPRRGRGPDPREARLRA